MYDTNKSKNRLQSNMNEEPIVFATLHIIMSQIEYLMRHLFLTLHEKCPNSELFLVRIFLFSDQK